MSLSMIGNSAYKKGFMLALTVLLISFCAYPSHKVTITDKSSNASVEGATIISNRGLILGITDSDGSIKVDKEKDFPLTVRCVGFESLTVQNVTDTIFLEPTTYELSEVTVKAGERHIRKITSYAREFCTGASDNDTMQLFAEYMLVTYVDDLNKKVKGFKKGDRSLHTRAVRRFARFANSDGLDSVAKPSYSDDVSALSFYNLLVGLPCNTFSETERIKSGAKTDSLMGKYSTSARYRKTDSNYIISYDKLADFENHRVSPMIFKIFGMTMDIDRMQSAFIYRATADSVYDIDDFIFNSGNIHALAKGKMFKWILGKTDTEVDCYAEIYPVEIEYLTVDEYKEDRKDLKEKKAIPFRIPNNVQPLPPAVVRLVDRVNGKSNTKTT